MITCRDCGHEVFLRRDQGPSKKPPGRPLAERKAFDIVGIFVGSYVHGLEDRIERGHYVRHLDMFFICVVPCGLREDRVAVGVDKHPRRVHT